MKTSLFIPAATAFPLLLACAEAGEATYSWFRFTPLGLRDNGTDSVQLAEFELRYQGEPVDTSSAIATNPGGDNPENEMPGNVIDGQFGSKWLDFNKAPLVIEFASPVTIDQYRLGTAGDAEDRDPVTWTLEGSENGTDWELIDQRTNYPVPYYRETYSAAIHIPPFTDLEITHFDISEVVVPNTASTSLTWDVINADTVSIQPSPGSVAASGTANVTPPVETDTTYVLTAVKGTEEATRNVTVRAVQGGSTACRYVRFTPVELRNTSTSNSIQISDFDFFLGTAPVSVSSVSSPGGDPSDGEGPDNLIDNDPNTKWLDYGKTGLVFDFGETKTIDRYRFTTGNDYPDRDPVRWTLEASTDGNDWTLIENMTAFDFPTPESRKQMLQVIPLPGPSIRPLPPFSITASAFDFSTGRMSLTFRSRENLSYRITASQDLIDWSEELAYGIGGTDGEDTTTVELDFTPTGKDFFRVEEE